MPAWFASVYLPLALLVALLLTGPCVAFVRRHGLLPGSRERDASELAHLIGVDERLRAQADAVADLRIAMRRYRQLTGQPSAPTFPSSAWSELEAAEDAVRSQLASIRDVEVRRLVEAAYDTAELAGVEAMLVEEGPDTAALSEELDAAYSALSARVSELYVRRARHGPQH